MLRYGYPLRSCVGVSLVTACCVWARSIIGCAGVGLARVFPLSSFSLVRLVYNEHLTLHIPNRDRGAKRVLVSKYRQGHHLTANITPIIGFVLLLTEKAGIITPHSNTLI